MLTFSQYNQLDEAWSKTIAANGKNTLTVKQDVEANPEDIYYIFINSPEKDFWAATGRSISMMKQLGNSNFLEDFSTKGSNIISYVKNECKNVLSGITPYTLTLRYPAQNNKDVIFGRMVSNRGSIWKNFLFVDANAMDDSPNVDRYIEISAKLRQEYCPDTLTNILRVMPLLEERIGVYKNIKSGEQETGWNLSALDEKHA